MRRWRRKLLQEAQEVLDDAEGRRYLLEVAKAHVVWGALTARRRTKP